jgi:hypothetical protein
VCGNFLLQCKTDVNGFPISGNRKGVPSKSITFGFLGGEKVMSGTELAKTESTFTEGVCIPHLCGYLVYRTEDNR